MNGSFKFRTHNFNYTNPEAGYQVRVSLDNLPVPHNPNQDVIPEEYAQPAIPPPTMEPITQNVGLSRPVRRDPIFAKRSNNPSWMDVTSKVITSEGGEISCASCKYVLKNPVSTPELLYQYLHTFHLLFKN